MSAAQKLNTEDEKLTANAANTNVESGAPGLTAANNNVELTEEQAEAKIASNRYNQYAELYEDFGIDVSQSRATTTEITSGLTNTVKAVLDGKLGGVDLAEIKNLEADKKLNKFYVAKMKAFLSSHLKGVHDSKGYKKFVSSVSSQKTITGIINLWLGCGLADSEKQTIDEAFSLAISTLLYGQGFMEPDRVSKYLEKAEARDKDGKSVKVLPILDKLLGMGNGKLPNQNSVPEQAITAQILSQTLLAGETDPSINLAEILNNIASARPEAKTMDPLVQESLDFIATFRKGVESKLGTSEISEIDKIATDRKVQARQEASTRIDQQIEAERKRIDKLDSDIEAEDKKYNELTTRIDILTPMATSGTPEARERENKLKERESINTSRGRFYETRRKIEVNIESLEKKKESLLSSSSTAEEREFETEKKNLAANLELANHVRRLAAYVNERTGQLEKSGVKIDFTEMPTVAALLELTKNPENLTKQEQSKKMALFFTDSAVLALDRELRGLRDVLTEKRTYTPQELSLAVLTEVNKKKYGYTQDTANFMAATCYVRIATEKNLRDAKRQTIEERAKHDLKGVDKYPFDEMLKRIVRDEAKGSITPSEESVLEGLNGSMSLDDLRKTLAEGSVSIDSLKFVMYNLVSTIAPRKCNDGSMVTLKGPKDIAEAEKLVDNLNRITAEYAALEVMSSAKSISASDPSKFGVVALADGLKAYQTKFDASERQIIIASKHRESYMTTRAKSKAILAELLATAKAEGWSKEQFEEEKVNRGIADLPERGNFKFRLNQARNYSREKAAMIKAGIKNAASSAWNAKGKAFKYATFPIWAGPYYGWKATKGVAKFTARKAKQALEFVTYKAPVYAATAALAPVGVAVNTIRGVRDGVVNAYENIGPANYQDVRDRTLTDVNSVLMPARTDTEPAEEEKKAT